MRRLICRIFGHNWVDFDAEPVCMFPVCVRCGKWTKWSDIGRSL